MSEITTKLQSVANALTILDFLADRGELSLVELADMLRVAPSTAHRLLSTLSELGYVRRDPVSKRFGVSLKVFKIGVSAIQQLGLAHIALPEMSRLNAISNETVSLGIPHGTEIMYVERIEAQQAVKSDYPLGHCAPMYCTALGKAYLSALPVEDRSALLDQVELRPMTSLTTVDRPRIEASLAEARTRRYAVDDRETDENLRCVASPIFDRRNRPVAAISIAGPAFRIELDTLHKWGQATSNSAAAISRAIGWAR